MYCSSPAALYMPYTPCWLGSNGATPALRGQRGETAALSTAQRNARGKGQSNTHVRATDGVSASVGCAGEATASARAEQAQRLRGRPPTLCGQVAPLPRSAAAWPARGRPAGTQLARAACEGSGTAPHTDMDAGTL